MWLVWLVGKGQEFKHLMKSGNGFYTKKCSDHVFTFKISSYILETGLGKVSKSGYKETSCEVLGEER